MDGYEEDNDYDFSKDNKEIYYSSFLAGLFLTKKDISYNEISKADFEFRSKYKNITLSEREPSNNINKLSKLFNQDNNGLHLCFDYDDLYNYNGVDTTVYDYLYSLTSDEIREFFGIDVVSMTSSMASSIMARK